MKKTEINKDDFLRYYIEENLSLKETAKKLNTSTMVVCRYAKENNIVKSKEAIRKNKENTEFITGNSCWSETSRKRRKETNLKKYGTVNPSQSDIVKNKIKNTCKDKYGVDCVLKSDVIKSKIKDTVLNKYGIDHLMKSDDFVLKFHENLTQDILNILNNKEEFKKYLGKYCYVSDVSKSLNCSATTILNRIHEYGFEDFLKYKTSKIETEITELLNSWNIKTERTKKIINPYEIDIFCKDYNIGIEINGSYWHSDIKKDKKYHYNKSMLGEQKNVFIYHIFEYEWENDEKKEKIISQLRNIFHLNLNKIYARNCDIRIVSKNEKSVFLNMNHLQGNDCSVLNYGLYYQDRLVSLMTFCKPRFSEKYDWELSRFCSLSGYNVVGGADKLFKYFLNNNSGSIVSYSNIAKTTGKLYDKLGFVLDHISDPNYVWCNSENKIKTRYQCQMKEEKESMAKSGYWRIYDCGNKVWTYIR